MHGKRLSVSTNLSGFDSLDNLVGGSLNSYTNGCWSTYTGSLPGSQQRSIRLWNTTITVLSPRVYKWPRKESGHVPPSSSEVEERKRLIHRTSICTGGAAVSARTDLPYLQLPETLSLEDRPTAGCASCHRQQRHPTLTVTFLTSLRAVLSQSNSCTYYWVSDSSNTMATLTYRLLQY